MVKKWTDVANSPEFQSLSPDQQEIARGQYFEQVISPQVPKDQLSAIKQQFDSQTKVNNSVQQQQQQQQQSKQPEESKSFFSSAVDTAKNIGAGALRGAGSIGATILAPADILNDALAGKGLSLESNRQRRAQMDQGLQMMGADPESLAYQGGKLGTEIVGTLPVGGILGKGVQAIAPGAAGIANALTTGGMKAGTAPGVTNMLTRVAGGAATGATSAGLIDPESAISGAVVGGALPPLVTGAGKVGKAVGSMFRGPQTIATDKLANMVGNNPTAINDAIAAINTYYPKGAENIPMSTATILKNPELLLAERASRARNPADWLPFDQAQNKAVWGNVENATANAKDLDQLRQVRSKNWASNMQDALDNFKPKKWAPVMDQLYDDVSSKLDSPAGQNEMRPVFSEIKRQMDELGPQFGPEHLAALRAKMQGSISGNPADPFASAPRSDPSFIALKNKFDEVLNDVTGDKWSKVNAQYAKDSIPITAAKSSQAIQNTFVTPEGVFRKTTSGDVPKVTQTGLNSAMARYGESKYGNALAGDTRNRLEATSNALVRRDLLNELKTAGTAGGGSNTLMDLLASGAERLIPFGGYAKGIIGAIGDAAQKPANALVDQALRNPDVFIKMLNDKSIPQSVKMRLLQQLPYRAAPAITAQ